jgi:hypothetical protein
LRILLVRDNPPFRFWGADGFLMLALLVIDVQLGLFGAVQSFHGEEVVFG